MERLTHERCNGIKTGYWSAAKKEELVQRLAAYEDTGLDPEQVAFLVSPEMREIAEIMKECLEDIQKGEEQYVWGVPAERLYQLAQAEKEGRLVVLEKAPDDGK